MIFGFTRVWYSSVKDVFEDYLGLNVLLSAFGLLQSAFQILIVHSSGLKKKRSSFLKVKDCTE